MVRSANRTRRWRSSAPVLCVVASAAGVGGCATTQQEAARLQLNAARVRASQVPVRVSPRQQSATVRVSQLEILDGTFVATVKNTGSGTADDLPIVVGYRTRADKRVVLNANSLLYSGDHLPLVRPGRSVTWVAPLRRIPRGDRPFALVGARPSPYAVVGATLPRIAVEHVRDGAGGNSVSFSLVNETSVPQYQMPVYALGTAAGRVAAAGTVFVEHLGSHATQPLRIRLTGRLGDASLRFEAPPTIFH